MSLLTAILTRWLDRSDPAARTTGYRYTTDRTYDEARALAGRHRALERERARRRIAAHVGRRPDVIQWRREA